MKRLPPAPPAAGAATEKRADAGAEEDAGRDVAR